MFFLALELTQNKNAFIDLLGFRWSQHIVTADGSEVGAWIGRRLWPTMPPDAGCHGSRGRLHHVRDWYGYPQHLMDIADPFAENKIKIRAGPGKHGISQAHFLYCIEPGGNRIELFGDAGHPIFIFGVEAVK